MDAFDTQVYNTFYGSSTGTSQDDPSLAHKLSLLFMVLAIGSLMNIDLPAYNIEAEKYHQLARAALFHTSIFDSPTLIAVQALVGHPSSSPPRKINSCVSLCAVLQYLMTYYLFLADRHGTASGARWAIMGIAVKVGQSVS